MPRRQRTFATRVALALALACAALMAAAGCGHGAEEPDGHGRFGMRLSAATAACSSAQADPTGGTVDVTVTVTGPADDGTGFVTLLAAQGQVQVNAVGLTVPKVPAGDQRIVTVKGNWGGTPIFSQRRALTIEADRELPLDMLLVRCADFGCLQVPGDYGTLLFPTVVPLPDGRVIIAGGFTATTTQGSNHVIAGPSNVAWLFDGRTGSFQRISQVMKDGRGAAGGIYIPSKRYVLLFGGAKQLTYAPGQGGVPFSLISTDAMTSYEVLSLDGLERSLSDPASGAEVFLTPPNTMKVRRAFPKAVRLVRDDAIVVTGGGSWPRDTATGTYEVVEYYHPKALDGVGGFVDPGNSLVLNAVRAGHSMHSLGVSVEGFTQALIWGGTTDRTFVGERFKEGSSQGTQVVGSFEPLLFEGAIPNPTYFHGAASINDKRILVVGGAEHVGSGNLAFPDEPKAWVLDFREDGGQPVLQVREVKEFGGNRIFPVIGVGGDRRFATVLGGWSDDQATAPADVLVADLGVPEPVFERQPALFGGRGGLGAAAMPNDALLLVGGIADPAALQPSVGAAETFIPDVICNSTSTVQP